MKKFLSLALALIMVLGLTGTVVAESIEAPVLWYNMGDTFLSYVRASLNKQLKAAGITYQDQDAANTQTLQTDQFTTALTIGPKVLCVNVVETGADGISQNMVDQAKAMDIPVVFFNRSVSEEVVKSFEKCCFIGTNYEQAGMMEGDMVADYLLADYEKYDLNGDGVISYVMFKGQEDNQEAIARTKYGAENANAKLVAAGKPELKFYDENNAQKYLLDQAGTWSRQAAQDYMTTILTQYNMDSNNMVELVIANNDEMALGAIQALQQAGFNYGEGTVTIPVFGVDATLDAVDAIGRGVMAGSIKQDAEGMAEAIVTVVSNLINGKDMFADLNENFTVEDGWKIVIPYTVYTGE